MLQFHENTVSDREKQRLQDYVTGVLTRFSKDRRVLMWDIYNEPGQSGNCAKSFNLLKLTWDWAQRVRPSQPLVRHNSPFPLPVLPYPTLPHLTPLLSCRPPAWTDPSARRIGT